MRLLVVAFCAWRCHANRKIAADLRLSRVMVRDADYFEWATNEMAACQGTRPEVGSAHASVVRMTDRLNEETIASVHIIRNARGELGLQVVAYHHGFESRAVPCAFGTLTGLFSVAADLTADALNSRKETP
jgi:hypothetical protein